MERFVGIIGIVVLLGAAFLLSNNKKKIKWRVLFWGLFLQLTMAVIVLSKDVLSFLGMFILFFMIVLFMLDKELPKVFKKKWLGIAVVLVSSLAIVGGFYLLESSHVFKAKETAEGKYIQVCYPQYKPVAEYGPFDNIKEAIFSPNGSSYAIVAISGGKEYLVVDGTQYGPFDKVMSVDFTRDNKDWLAFYAIGGDISYLKSDGTAVAITSENIPAFSNDGETWGKEVVSQRWYTRVGGETLGVFTSVKPDAVGGYVTYFLIALVIAAIVFSILKSKKVLKNAFVSRLAWSLTLLVTLAVLWARGTTGAMIMSNFSAGIVKFLSLTDLGTDFLFHSLVNIDFVSKYGISFAVAILPTIIFFSSFMSILYYFGILQAVVAGMAKFMSWTMGTSGAESLSCAANVFIGQTEAPLLIKPYLKDMTKSELTTIMVGGFGTIAGGVMAGYIKMGVSATHILAASMMAAPACLMIGKILYPETEHSKTAGDVEMPKVETADNVLGAAANGVTDGLQLALNVGAMLIAFIALIGFVDLILAWGDKLIDGKLLGGALIAGSTEYKGIFPGSLKTLLGSVFRPLAWIMGVPWKDAAEVGNLLGIKISVNEFVAYSMLSQHIQAGDIGEKAIVIATYSLCGFANFSSIGIQIGGIGSLVPERRSEIASVGFRAMIGGAIVSMINATIAGLLLR